MDTKWTDEIEADFEEWRKAHAHDGDIDWEKKDESEGAISEDGTLLG